MSPLRPILVLCAVAVIAFALARGQDVRDCDDARAVAFAAAVAGPTASPPDGGRALADSVIDACRGSEPLVASALALVRSDALGGARELAEAALDRDPDAFQAHDALAVVLEAQGLPQEAAPARARARELNPLAPAPRLSPTGPAGPPPAG